jgi:polyisoprenoid-binding protein YceI
MTSETAIPTPAQGETVTYCMVPEQSRFTVQSFAEGLFSAFAHDPVIVIPDFNGELNFIPETFANACLSVSVNPNSLAVGSEMKERDRLDIERTMLEEVLETERYSEIVYRSTNISVNRLAEGRYRVRVIGDLTLHGITQKGLWVSAEAQFGAKRLRAIGDFSLKQSDFGIKRHSAAGGTIKAKNELKFSFDIVAEKKQAGAAEQK